MTPPSDSPRDEALAVLDRITVAATMYRADQVDARDRPSSWGKLAALLDAVDDLATVRAALRSGSPKPSCPVCLCDSMPVGPLCEKHDKEVEAHVAELLCVSRSSSPTEPQGEAERDGLTPVADREAVFAFAVPSDTEARCAPAEFRYLDRAPVPARLLMADWNGPESFGDDMEAGMEIRMARASRPLPQPQETRELLCMLCGQEHPCWYAPNELWNPVMRLPDGSDRWPFVCPTCFARKAEEAGISTIFELRLPQPQKEKI